LDCKDRLFLQIIWIKSNILASFRNYLQVGWEFITTFAPELLVFVLGKKRDEQYKTTNEETNFTYINPYHPVADRSIGLRPKDSRCGHRLVDP
jgi:hypothetical protein